jgi:hypothetical protein
MPCPYVFATTFHAGTVAEWIPPFLVANDVRSSQSFRANSVIPAKAGIQKRSRRYRLARAINLDSGLRQNDGWGVDRILTLAPKEPADDMLGRGDLGGGVDSGFRRKDGIIVWA